MDQAKTSQPGAGKTEQAVSWFLRIQESVSQSDFRAWRHWLAEDEAHAEAFDAVTAFWHEAEQVDDLPWPTDQELASDTYDGFKALPIPEKPLPNVSPGDIPRRAWFALAASVAVVGIFSMVLFQGSGQEQAEYHTNIAEHRVIQLEDGSSITLGARSDVSVVFDTATRHVALEHGEAYFKVAKDSTRPFVVAAGTRIVRALGTEFNVNIGVRDITVSVVEGLVSVEGPATDLADNSPGPGSAMLSKLKPGDVMNFNNTGEIGIASELDPLITTSWLDRRLAYVGVPLESVVADVNRYSETTLIIGDEATGQLIFTGTIFSDDIGDWLVGLEKVFPLRLVEVESYGILLIRKNS